MYKLDWKTNEFFSKRIGDLNQVFRELKDISKQSKEFRARLIDELSGKEFNLIKERGLYEVDSWIYNALIEKYLYTGAYRSRSLKGVKSFIEQQIGGAAK